MRGNCWLTGIAGVVVLAALGVVGVACVGHRSFAPAPVAVGPQRAPFDLALLSAGRQLGESERSALTRAQRVVYGSHYIDFFATMLPKESESKTCFSIRIETDDNRARDALKWDAYLKRVGYVDTRVTFLSLVPVLGESYPLVYTGEACADYVIDGKFPVYLYIESRIARGIEPIRLEWEIPL